MFHLPSTSPTTPDLANTSSSHAQSYYPRPRSVGTDKDLYQVISVFPRLRAATSREPFPERSPGAVVQAGRSRPLPHLLGQQLQLPVRAGVFVFARLVAGLRGFFQFRFGVRRGVHLEDHAGGGGPAVFAGRQGGGKLVELFDFGLGVLLPGVTVFADDRFYGILQREFDDKL